jgi:cyclophilin family peptidyl-prolyl cis-trans isomerase
MKQLLLVLGILAASSLPIAQAAEKSPAPEKPAAAAPSPRVLVVTSMGNFTMELNAERAPLTVANFLNYVDQGHYTNTIVHRVVSNFVVQMGGFDTDYKPRTAAAKVPNESGNGLSNVRGTVGLARSQDPHGGNAQFYVNIADNAALDPNQTRWGYAVFGKVVSGMETVDRISDVATGAHGIMKEEVPLKQIVVLKIERVPGS